MDSFNIGTCIYKLRIYSFRFEMCSIKCIIDSFRFRIYKIVFRMYKILKMRIFTSKRTSWEEFINVKEVGL